MYLRFPLAHGYFHGKFGAIERLNLLRALTPLPCQSHRDKYLEISCLLCMSFCTDVLFHLLGKKDRFFSYQEKIIFISSRTSFQLRLYKTLYNSIHLDKFQNVGNNSENIMDNVIKGIKKAELATSIGDSLNMAVKLFDQNRNLRVVNAL